MVKIKTKTNFDFDKLEKKINSIILKSIYRPIGDESKKQVEDTFKTSIDMNGNPFEPISDFYVKFNEYKSGKSVSDAPLVATGRLSTSIKMKTNKNGVTVFSNTLYGAKHLKKRTRKFKINGKARSAEVPQRLWFYKDEQQVIEKMKVFVDKQNTVLVNKIKSQLKTKMSNLGKTLFF